MWQNNNNCIKTGKTWRRKEAKYRAIKSENKRNNNNNNNNNNTITRRDAEDKIQRKVKTCEK
jgi:hypothetical protein